MNPIMINTTSDLANVTFGDDVYIDVPASITTPKADDEQYTANVTLRIRIKCNGLELLERAATNAVIVFANNARSKHAKHLRSIDGTTVDVDIVALNERKPAVPSESKAIDVLVNAAKAGKLTAEQKALLASMLA